MYRKLHVLDEVYLNEVRMSRRAQELVFTGDGRCPHALIKSDARTCSQCAGVKVPRALDPRAILVETMTLSYRSARGRALGFGLR